MRVVLLSGLVALAGCSTLDDWPREGYVVCPDDREYNIFSDPQHCGGCPGERGHEVCAEGVACVQGYCDYTSSLHCGEAGRMCMAGSSCVAVPEVDSGVDSGVPHGPVVEGYACTLVSGDAGVDEPGSEEGGEGEGRERFAFKQARLGAPSWIFVPGESEGCRTGDDVRCHHAYVTFTDICGERCGPFDFDYDFHIMTTEMSRGQYRAAMCDCGFIESAQCADVCTDGGPGIDELPMTGLNWCMAQAACEAVGGRLPTTLERARLDEVIANEHRLSAEPRCTEWSAVLGSRPQVLECIDEEPELVAVNDPRGAVPLGAAALWEPIMVHHPVGNVAEWLYDPPAGFRCGEYADESTTLRVPVAWEGLRTIQGRSVMSPSGVEEGRAIGVGPSTRAVDLGVRCAKPRPGSTSALLAALPGGESTCDAQPLGLRPVRRNGYEPVYRAVEACAVSRAETSIGTWALDQLAKSFLRGETPIAWRRGDEPEIGRAWFGEDAQWWVDESARVGESLSHLISVDPTTERRISLQWAAVSIDVAEECAERMSSAGYADQDGYIVRQLDFVVDRDGLRGLKWGDGEAREMACRHLTCESEHDPNGCASTCSAWRLPIVIGFEQVEQFAYPDLCR